MEYLGATKSKYSFIKISLEMRWKMFIKNCWAEFFCFFIIISMLIKIPEIGIHLEKILLFLRQQFFMQDQIVRNSLYCQAREKQREERKKEGNDRNIAISNNMNYDFSHEFLPTKQICVFCNRQDSCLTYE